MEERPSAPAQSVPAQTLSARTIRRLWLMLGAVLAATVLTEIWIPSEPHFEIERLFAFAALFGFLACAAMIVAATALASLLKRPEDFYRERGDE